MNTLKTISLLASASLIALTIPVNAQISNCQTGQADGPSGGCYNEVKFHAKRQISQADIDKLLAQNNWRMASPAEVEAAWKHLNLNQRNFSKMSNGGYAAPSQVDGVILKRGLNLRDSSVSMFSGGFFYVDANAPIHEVSEAKPSNDIIMGTATISADPPKSVTEPPQATSRPPASQPPVSQTPYYQTMLTKTCSFGPAAHTWIAKLDGGQWALVSAKSGNDYYPNAFYIYDLPPRPGLSGRFKFNKYDLGAPGYSFFIKRDNISIGLNNGAGNGVQSLVMMTDNFEVSGPGFTIGNIESLSFDNSVFGTVPGKWGGPGYTGAGDFNGDGYTDIATAIGNIVHTHLIKPSNPYHVSDVATTEQWETPSNWRWGGQAYTFFGDFDGNGKDDIASAIGSNVGMLLSNGKSFDNARWSAPISWGGEGYNWTGDFNGDGKDDIASARGSNMTIAYSNGAGFSVKTHTVATAWAPPGFAWAEDINNDGKTDFISANGCNLDFFESTGNGFKPAVKWTISLPTQKPTCKAIIEGRDDPSNFSGTFSRPTAIYDPNILGSGNHTTEGFSIGGDTNVKELNDGLVVPGFCIPSWLE